MSRTKRIEKFVPFGFVKKGSVLLFLIFFLLPFSSNAQKELLKFENFSKDDGLLHSYILSFCQDSEGFIWIGSWGGLNRYDGTNVVSYTSKQFPGFDSDIVHEIFESKLNHKSILWLGTESGLVRFEKTTNTFSYFEELKTPINSIAEDNNGILWLGTKTKGLYKFDPNSLVFTPTSLSDNSLQPGESLRINKLIYEEPDILWIGSNNQGLIEYRCSTNSFTSYTCTENTKEQSAANRIYCINNRGADLLIGTWGAGITIFNKQSKQFSNFNPLLADGQPINKTVTGIVADNNNNLWISTYGGGLYKVSTAGNTLPQVKKFEVENRTNSICSNVLRTLYKDRTGNLWIASSGGGLSKIDFFKHKFKHYVVALNDQTQENYNNISAISQDQKGNIWYGTRNNGLYKYTADGKNPQHILLNTTNVNDAQNAVRVIYCDRFNRTWVGTDDGLFLFTDRGITPVKHYRPASDNEVIALCLDNNDALWISVSDQGLYRLKASEIQANEAHFESFRNSTNTASSLSSNLILGLYVDSKNQLWCATSKGLDCYNPSTNSFDRYLNNNFSCIAEPKAGNGKYLWLGTYGNGIYLMNKENRSILNFSTDNGLCHNNCNGILEDVNGYIWISTGKGIARINSEGLYEGNFNNQTSKNDIVANRLKNFSKNEGLQGHEFNRNASASFQNGRLAFGGQHGINIFNPTSIIENSYIFPVIITDFKVFNKSIKADSTKTTIVFEYLTELNLNYKQNYFTIDFTEICPTSPEKAVYSYMLEGYDKEWITTDAKHTSATYTGLSNGNYVFKVKAANADGYWNNQTTKLAITIRPPFWATLLFKLLVVVLLAGIAFVVLNKLKQQQTNQRKKALEQQQQLFEKEKLKTDLDYKNRELASTTMHLVKKNEKLIEIKSLLTEAKESTPLKDKAKINDIITSIEHELKQQDNWESFELSFNLIHNNFIKRLTDAYPALSTTDIKICAYMRMNLSSKEIANLLNIAPTSLETSRIRIRKKMNLDPTIYLSNYILRF